MRVRYAAVLGAAALLTVGGCTGGEPRRRQRPRGRSLGGPYPTGDIRKAYPKAGTFPVRADVTYTGQFRVGGGAWIDIPGDVTIQGTPEDLRVRAAKARLYAR